MQTKLKKFIPLAILGALLLAAMLVRMNPPEAPQRPAFSGPMMV
ncbi:MAG: hypothetical protein ACI88G_001805, partial [Woeseiaceae bacterium]